MIPTLPYRFNARWYQLIILKAIAKGYKRIIIILPRRAGKDLTVLNAIFIEMLQNIGVYFYFFPEAKQARRTIWEGIHDGMRFMDHMPAQYVKRKNQTDMSMELVGSAGDPGSIFHLMPGNEPDRIVGSNPRLVAFSEYALMNPATWDYAEPILVQNGGIGIFLYTPRGDNHGHSLYQTALMYPDEWYVLRLTSDDTRHLATATHTHEENFERAKRAYLARHGDLALFEQEFMTSFEAPLQGAYYADVMRTLSVDGKITTVPWDPALPVYTSWDLGISMTDECVIWFVQVTNAGQWRWLKCLHGVSRNASHWAAEILALEQKGWRITVDFLPHDGGHKEKGTGRTYKEQLQEFLPHHQIKVVERIQNKMNRIYQTRDILPMSIFDAEGCKRGIDALKTFRRDFDEEKEVHAPTPKHDWSSHFADAFGQIIQYYKSDVERQAEIVNNASSFDPYAYAFNESV